MRGCSVGRIVAICSLLAALIAAAGPTEAAQASRERDASSVATRDLLALVPDPTAIAQATLGTVTAAVYTIAATGVGPGTIDPTGNRLVTPGTDQTFTMTPLPCALVDNVRVDGVNLGPLGTYTFHSVNTNHTIEASFVPAPPDAIVASAGAGGTISPAGATVYDCGSAATFTMTPEECFLIGDVLVDGASQGAVPSFTFHDLRASHTIRAKFVAGVNFAISASAGANGTISPSGTVQVPCGSDRVFTITPAGCFRVADVVVDGVAQGPVTSYAFTNVRSPHAISASFVSSPDPSTITASAGVGGTIDPAGAVVVPCGSNQTFTIKHDPCYQIANVLVDGVPQGPVTSFKFSNVGASHTIAASFFSSPQYTITANAGVGGSISPVGAVQVDCGANQNFTMTPGTGFHVTSVAVDGHPQGAVSSYTFTNVNDPHSISALFSNQYDITVVAPHCSSSQIRPVVIGDGLSPNTTYSFDVQPLDCDPPAPGAVLAHAGSIQTDELGTIVATNAGCFPSRRYSLIIDIVGNGVFVPDADPVACFEPSNATAANGIQDLDGAITPEGATLSWWVMDLASYRGFVVHRAPEGGDEMPVTPVPLAPPASHPPAQVHWRDDSAVPGTRYAYRIEALKVVGSDWYGPVRLTIPAAPQQLALKGAMPNPFSGTTRLAVDMPAGEGDLRLDEFDVAGRHVRALRRGTMSPGQDVVDWDGLDDTGAPARGGLYMVRLQSGARASVLRVMKLD